MVDRPEERDVPAFDRALREWGRRPPRIPAGTAATRLEARLGRRESRFRRWRLAATAATVLGILGGMWLISLDGSRAPEPVDAPAAPSPSVPPLGDNVVLWWLDAETPVYFVIEAPDSGEGE
jgi:hypothetical protein